MREKDHVADRRRAGQQHDEAVDTDAFAGGRRHAVFEGADVVGVVVHGFVVAGCPPSLLCQRVKFAAGSRVISAQGRAVAQMLSL